MDASTTSTQELLGDILKVLGKNLEHLPFTRLRDWLAKREVPVTPLRGLSTMVAIRLESVTIPVTLIDKDLLREIGTWWSASDSETCLLLSKESNWYLRTIYLNGTVRITPFNHIESEVGSTATYYQIRRIWEGIRVWVDYSISHRRVIADDLAVMKAGFPDFT